MQRSLIQNDLQVALEKIKSSEEKAIELHSEVSNREAQINKLEKESSANHDITDRLEEMVRALTQELCEKDQAIVSLRTENNVLQTRLREVEQAGSAQDEILTELRKDKQVLGLKMEEQSQAINALQVNWQSSEDRVYKKLSLADEYTVKVQKQKSRRQG